MLCTHLENPLNNTLSKHITEYSGYSLKSLQTLLEHSGMLHTHLKYSLKSLQMLSRHSLHISLTLQNPVGGFQKHTKYFWNTEHSNNALDTLWKHYKYFKNTYWPPLRHLGNSLDTFQEHYNIHWTLTKILRSSGYILEKLQILIYRKFDGHSSTLKKPWGKIWLIFTIRFSNTQEDILNTFCKNWKYIWNTHWQSSNTEKIICTHSRNVQNAFGTVLGILHLKISHSRNFPHTVLLKYSVDTPQRLRESLDTFWTALSVN